MTVLVDSDILVEVSRNRNQEILDRWVALSDSRSQVLYSPVSLAELWAGARDHEHEVLTRLFDVLTCVEIDADTGRRAGNYLRLYRRSHSLELGDALIAASAAANDAQLWTRNRKHFPMKELQFF